MRENRINRSTDPLLSARPGRGRGGRPRDEPRAPELAPLEEDACVLFNGSLGVTP